MLEGLHDVPWADLEHAYGAATNVPDLLSALLSPDPERRSKARWHLYGNIYHQGTRYEASAYAAPFLLEMLADPATPERPEMLELLTSLSIGMDEVWLPSPFPAAGYRERAVGGLAVLRSFPPVSDDEDDDSRYLHFESLPEEDQVRFFAHVELAVYDAVRAGMPTLRPLLDEADPQLRVAAAYALGWFVEDAAGSIPHLVAATADTDTDVVATALVALGLLTCTDEAGRRAVDAALTDERDIVRWAAAIALARLDGSAASPGVQAELLAWVGGDSRRHAGIPYYGGDLAGYAVLALRQLGDAHHEVLFDTLLGRVPSVSGPEALPVVGQALQLAFPDGRVADGTPFADLNRRQQRLLAALAASPDTWGWGEYGLFGNFTSMVASYGLPRDVEMMRAYTSKV